TPLLFSTRRRHPRFSRDWSSDVCSSDPAGHDVGGIQLTLGGFKAGITDQTGSTTHQRNRLMAGVLEAGKHQQPYQMTTMQTVSGWIEAAIQSDGTTFQMPGPVIIRGNLIDQATGFKIV